MSGEIISEPLADPIAEAVAESLSEQVDFTECSCQDEGGGTCWYHLRDIERARVVALRIMEVIREAEGENV